MVVLYLIFLLGCLVSDSDAFIQLHEYSSFHHDGSCAQECETMISNVKNEVKKELLSEFTDMKNEIELLKGKISFLKVGF